MTIPYKNANSWCTQYPIDSPSPPPYLGAPPPVGPLLSQAEPILIVVAPPCPSCGGSTASCGCGSGSGSGLQPGGPGGVQGGGGWRTFN
jgi:hypothetical protein